MNSERKSAILLMRQAAAMARGAMALLSGERHEEYNSEVATAIGDCKSAAQDLECAADDLERQ